MSYDLKLWPIKIYEDRYMGTYSGGLWIAVANTHDEHSDVEEFIYAGDTDCCNFWDAHKDVRFIGVGNTPNEALKALIDKQTSE